MVYIQYYSNFQTKVLHLPNTGYKITDFQQISLCCKIPDIICKISLLLYKLSSYIFPFSHPRFLCFAVGDQYFQFMALLFGLSPSAHKSACPPFGISMNPAHLSHRLPGCPHAEGLFSHDLVCQHPKDRTEESQNASDRLVPGVKLSVLTFCGS